MELHSTLALRTGGRMPVLGLGTWQLDDDTPGTVAEALRLGYRMIDTSGDYNTQPGIAEALQRTAVPREDIFLVTKVEEHEDAYRATVENVAADLAALDDLDERWPSLGSSPQYVRPAQSPATKKTQSPSAVMPTRYPI